MKFSQRIGKTAVREIAQIDGIDEVLTIRLWNTILEDFCEPLTTSHRAAQSELADVFLLLWKEFFDKPADEIPRSSYDRSVDLDEVKGILRIWFFKAAWFEKYDLIEFFANEEQYYRVEFVDECNKVLERERSAYRIIEHKLVQITDKQELEAVEAALENADGFVSVTTHLQTAIGLLADRKSTDYRNAIKESISAVESLCKTITGNPSATLGTALSAIEKKHPIHAALKAGLSKIYGYTSDAGGIRHGLLDSDAPVEFEDAKFMLVMCSAFINYLKAKTL